MAIQSELEMPPWPAPAKINLFLHVTGRRNDGYHELQTIFQFLDFADELRFSIRADGAIKRANDIPGVPEDTDLVVRAACLLAATAGHKLGVEIEVTKRLPIGGGLGGGSSNAATTLVALNVLWGLNFSPDRLAELGLSLGADVPVFVGGRAAWAEGVGERLSPIEIEEPWSVVVHPGGQVSTAEIFNDPQLTRHTPPIRMHAFSLAGTHNDCEPVTRRLYPEIDRAMVWLAQFGSPRMTGTGACIYALFDDEATARRVAAQIPAPWQGFCARCQNRSSLMTRLELATKRPS